MVLRSVFAAVLVLMGNVAVFGQQPDEISYHDDSQMPTGSWGNVIQTLIDTVNSQDPKKVKLFLQNHCTESFRDGPPMEAHLAVWGQFSRQTGGVQFHSIRSYKPERANQLVVIVKDKNFRSWRGITVYMDPSQEGLVAGLQISPARTPTNVSEPALSESEMIDEVHQTLGRLVEADVFSGTVLIASGDKILLQFASGEASKRFHVKNNIDTKFNLGSMNKMFTAVAINQLAQQGKLSLDETIDSYVDESWLPKEVTSKIKIQHLLSHTSGLGSYFNDKYWNSSRERFRDVNDFKPLVQGEKLAFEPGSRFRYSNTGMLLLGVVIEQAAKQSYFEYIRENIYEPAGMKDSDSFAMDVPVENLAIGYILDSSSPVGWRNNIFKHVIKGGPAGGGFSTVGDLHRFARALETEKLVSNETLKKMWTDHSGTGYGHGFSLENGAAGLVTGHGGGFAGLNGKLDIYSDRGFIVAVLANYDGAASPVADKIKQLVSRIQATE